MTYNTKLLVLLILYVKNTKTLYLPQFEPFLRLAEFLELIDSDSTEDMTADSLEDLDELITGEVTSVKSVLKQQVKPLHVGPIHFQTFGPDMCASCLHYFGDTYLGRVREGCFFCYGKNKEFFFDPWPRRIATLLNTPQDYIDWHMSQALYMCRYGMEKEYVR